MKCLRFKSLIFDGRGIATPDVETKHCVRLFPPTNDWDEYIRILRSVQRNSRDSPFTKDEQPPRARLKIDSIAPRSGSRYNPAA
jgi:hypothetical protein